MIGVGRERDLLDCLRPIRCALDEELARLPLEIVLRRLEQVRGELLRLVAHFARCDRGRRSRHRCRARRVRAEPVRRVVSVALLDGDVLGRYAELVGHDLREGRLMALAL